MTIDLLENYQRTLKPNVVQDLFSHPPNTAIGNFFTHVNTSRQSWSLLPLPFLPDLLPRRVRRATRSVGRLRSGNGILVRLRSIYIMLQPGPLVNPIIDNVDVFLLHCHAA